MVSVQLNKCSHHSRYTSISAEGREQTWNRKCTSIPTNQFNTQESPLTKKNQRDLFHTFIALYFCSLSVHHPLVSSLHLSWILTGKRLLTTKSPQYNWKSLKEKSEVEITLHVMELLLKFLPYESPLRWYTLYMPLKEFCLKVVKY